MECQLMYVEEVSSSGKKIWRKLGEKVKKALAKYQVRVCQMAGNAVQEDTSKYYMQQLILLKFLEYSLACLRVIHPCSNETYYFILFMQYFSQFYVDKWHNFYFEA